MGASVAQAATVHIVRKDVKSYGAFRVANYVVSSSDGKCKNQISRVELLKGKVQANLDSLFADDRQQALNDCREYSGKSFLKASTSSEFWPSQNLLVLSSQGVSFGEGAAHELDWKYRRFVDLTSGKTLDLSAMLNSETEDAFKAKLKCAAQIAFRNGGAVVDEDGSLDDAIGNSLTLEPSANGDLHVVHERICYACAGTDFEFDVPARFARSFFSRTAIRFLGGQAASASIPLESCFESH